MTAGRLNLAVIAMVTAASSWVAAVSARAAGIPLVRRWLGPQYWANRLQDWQLKDGRIECLAFMPWLSVRTANLLTYEVRPGPGQVRLTVRTGRFYTENFAGDDANGWSGFLIGIGQGRLDYRAAALVHGLSGQGGGIQCVFGLRGGCTFRDHSSQTDATGFAELPCRKDPPVCRYVRSLREDVRLSLLIRPARSAGRYDLILTADDEKTEQRISSAILPDVPESQILGGIGLVSNPAADRGHPQIGNQFWFRDLQVTGDKLVHYPQRSWGPIAGVLYSLNGTILRLTVQFMPLGVTARHQPRQFVAARLDYRPEGTQADWTAGPTAAIKIPSQTALFRIADWDASRNYDYRIVPLRPDGSDGPESSCYSGLIRRDPADHHELVIAAFTGCYAVGRPFDYELRPRPFEAPQGRFTPEQIWVPCPPLLRSVARQRPDLLCFTGDQIYEDAPTLPDPSSFPAEDFLYKWLHWMHSFRELTDRTPTIVLVDDHDVFQGNLWGWSGRPCPSQDPGTDGGYWKEPGFVNMVERCQCAHNPDPVDPAPIQRGIAVRFAAFRYGGVSFALLEDRKFKTPRGVPPDQAELLGPRQEAFLRTWARDRRPGEPKVVITQTALASVHTSPTGQIVKDYDSNGYPKPARDRAVALIAQAGALVLAGDTHLGMVLYHLTEAGPPVPQFIVPAVASRFQRWWQPAAAASQPLGPTTQPLTYQDPFGNRVRVVAAANPRIAFAEASKYPGQKRLIIDRRLTRNGYGIVRIDKKARRYILECWPWNADPLAGAQQYEGWPIVVPFPKPAQPQSRSVLPGQPNRP